MFSVRHAAAGFSKNGEDSSSLPAFFTRLFVDLEKRCERTLIFSLSYNISIDIDIEMYAEQKEDKSYCLKTTVPITNRSDLFFYSRTKTKYSINTRIVKEIISCVKVAL